MLGKRGHNTYCAYGYKRTSIRLPAKKSDLPNSPSSDFFQRLQNVHVAVLAQVREVQGAVPDIVLLRWGYAKSVAKAKRKLRIQNLLFAPRRFMHFENIQSITRKVKLSRVRGLTCNSCRLPCEPVTEVILLGDPNCASDAFGKRSC